MLRVLITNVGANPIRSILAPPYIMTGLRDTGYTMARYVKASVRMLILETTEKDNSLGDSERLSIACGDIAK